MMDDTTTNTTVTTNNKDYYFEKKHTGDVDIAKHEEDCSSTPDSIDAKKWVPTYNWNKKITWGPCGCFSFVMQLVLVAALGSFLFGFNLSLLNTSINHIGWELEFCDYKSHPADGITDCDRGILFKAFISTAVFIGAAVGSMTSGNLLGIGRRMVMLVSMVVFVFGIVSSVVANSFSALLWARLTVGYGVGVVSVVAPTYISEISPKEKRGSLGVLHQLFITIGIFVAVLIGLPLALADEIPAPEKINDALGETDANTKPLGDISTFSKIWWRVMLGLGILPVMLGLYLLISVYSFETPHFYIEQKKYGDARELLRRIYKTSDVSDKLQEIQTEVELGQKAKASGVTLGAALRQSDYRHVVIVGVAVAAFQQLSGINAFIASSNKIFSDAGLDGAMSTIASTALTLVNTLMTFPAVPLVEKLGRKTLLVWGAGICTVATLPGAVAGLINSDSDAAMWLSLVGAIIFICSFATTLGPVTWVYLFEMFPSDISGAAAGAGTAVNWVAGILMVFVTQFISSSVAYAIFTVMSGLATAFFIFQVRETKGLPLGQSPYITRAKAPADMGV